MGCEQLCPRAVKRAAGAGRGEKSIRDRDQELAYDLGKVPRHQDGSSVISSMLAQDRGLGAYQSYWQSLKATGSSGGRERVKEGERYLERF